MIRGFINDGLELKVVVEISNGDGAFESVEAVLDTGFGGGLTLPIDAVERLGLKCVNPVHLIPAGDRQMEGLVYQGFVKWFGREREIDVIAAEGQPLLGMALLDGCKITVRARPGGEALIEEDSES